MPWPGFEPGEWDPQSHVLSKHSLNMKKINSLNLLTYYNMLIQIYKS